MITIIVGTNRANSNSAKVAREYKTFLAEEGLGSRIYDLASLPANFLTSDMYGERSQEVAKVIEEVIDPATCFVFVLPEYHGSYPGVVKLFLDGVESKYFQHKYAVLVGVASGRQGNARGLDAFGNVLNYLQMEVLSKKVKLSGIENLLNDEGKISNEGCLGIVKGQITRMKKYFLQQEVEA